MQLALFLVTSYILSWLIITIYFVQSFFHKHLTWFTQLNQNFIVFHIKEMAQALLSKDSRLHLGRHIWLNNQAGYQNQVSGSANGCLDYKPWHTIILYCLLIVFQGRNDPQWLLVLIPEVRSLTFALETLKMFVVLCYQ